MAFEKRTTLQIAITKVILTLLLLHQTRSASNANPLLSSADGPPVRDHVDHFSAVATGQDKEIGANGFRPKYENIDWSEDDKSEHTQYAEGPTIAKVSMLYGQNPRSAYVRALRSHRVHNRRFNYGMFVLEEDAVGGFWNKPLYLLSLLMAELAKPPSERLQWLMWVDADLILVNPSIPLESFLPPPDLADQIHFISGRDQNGLNTGSFFLRVSPWSVHMMNKALALPVYHPELDLGNSFDQLAMSRVLMEDYGYGKEADVVAFEGETSSERLVRLAKLSRPFLFQPREWHNTYEFDSGYEGGEARSGHLLVHFPGLEDRRWDHMDKWLNEIVQNPRLWDVPFGESIYAQQIPEYWEMVRTSRTLIRTANETLAYLPPYSDDYARLRSATDLCESLLTNTSYVIGPGHDLLADMRQEIDSLRTAVQLEPANDGVVANTATETNTIEQESPPADDGQTLPASVQCTCIGECTNEDLRRIADNPLCKSWR